MGRKLHAHIVSVGIHCVAELVDEGLQPAFFDLFGIFYLESAGGGIAWIGKKGLTLLASFRIYFVKNIFSDQCFSPEFGFYDTVAGKFCLERYGAHGAYVVGHFFPLDTIAAAGSANQRIVFIHERDGATVKFWLDAVLNVAVGRNHAQFPHLRVEISQVVGVVRILQ